MEESIFREKLAVDAYRGGEGAMLASMDVSPGTFRCHRGRLEQLLRDGQRVRWGQTINGIEATSEIVLTHIEGEVSIQSKILIGADGVHSKVRKSMAPNIPLKVLPYVVYNGVRKMTAHEYDGKVERAAQGSNIIQSRSNDVFLQISVNDFSAEEAMKQDVDELTDQGVLLIGDAVHAMPIFSGEGANSAMKDAVDLAEHIFVHGLHGIQDFYAEKYEMWKKGIEQSEERLAEMHRPIKLSI